MTDEARARPERTCVGCRRRCPAESLIRLIAPEGRVMVAPRRHLPRTPSSIVLRTLGRGAWIHPRSECLGAALKERAFARAFRRAVELPAPEELFDRLVSAGRGPSFSQGQSNDRKWIRTR